jgi:hypothetical protein
MQHTHQQHEAILADRPSNLSELEKLVDTKLVAAFRATIPLPAGKNWTP